MKYASGAASSPDANVCIPFSPSFPSICPPCNFMVKWTNLRVDVGPRAHACQSGPRRCGSISTLCWNNPQPAPLPACLPARYGKLIGAHVLKTPLVTGIKRFLTLLDDLIELREPFRADRGLGIKLLSLALEEAKHFGCRAARKNDVSRHDSSARAN